MQFTSRTDIEAPLAFVYETLSDFEGWERAALRRGADVTRSDSLRSPGPGMAWTVAFRFRGKDRRLALKLTELEPNARMACSGKGKMFEGEGALAMVSLAPNRTRLVVHVDARPLSLGARLVLQSVKLARGKVQTGLNKRLAALAADIEQRHASTRRR